jgi:hypothetical protein
MFWRLLAYEGNKMYKLLLLAAIPFEILIGCAFEMINFSKEFIVKDHLTTRYSVYLKIDSL